METSMATMSPPHPSIPVLDLAGTPAQIGAAHGESQRPRIREHINVFVDGERVAIDKSLTAQSIVHVIPAVAGG